MTQSSFDGAIPAVKIMQALGLVPDPWQIEVLEAGQARLLLNCSRQARRRWSRCWP